MTAITVISVEGVLAERGTALPTAIANPTGLRLVEALRERWTSIGFMTTTTPTIAREWLKGSGVSQWAWIEQAAPEARAAALMALLASRRDRCELFVDSTSIAFPTLTKVGITTMLFHSGTYELGDWRQESSWLDQAMVGPEIGEP